MRNKWNCLSEFQQVIEGMYYVEYISWVRRIKKKKIAFSITVLMMKWGKAPFQNSASKLGVSACFFPRRMGGTYPLVPSTGWCDSTGCLFWLMVWWFKGFLFCTWWWYRFLGCPKLPLRVSGGAAWEMAVEIWPHVCAVGQFDQKVEWVLQSSPKSCWVTEE